MRSVKLLDKDWKEIDILYFDVIPSAGDYVYSTKKNAYYVVSLVVHHSYEDKILFRKVKRQSINLIVTEYTMNAQ